MVNYLLQLVCDGKLQYAYVSHYFCCIQFLPNCLDARVIWLSDIYRLQSPRGHRWKFSKSSPLMQVKNLTALFVHCTYQKPLYVWDNNGSVGLDWLTEWMKFSSLILIRLYKRHWVDKGVLWSKSLFSIEAFYCISSHPKHRPLPNRNLCNLCNAHDVSPTPNFSNTNCLLVICIVNWICKSWLHCTFW